MKTPDEVKRELRLCKDDRFCEWCGMNDICEKNEFVIECIEHLESRLAQVERERDAAISDLTHYSMCAACKHFKEGCKCLFVDDCLYGTEGRFEWRGVCPENTKEKNNESIP